MFRVLRVVLLLGLLAPLPAWSQRPMRVTFVSPTEGTERFWKDVADVMQAAARDLGIDLSIRVAGPSATARATLLKEVLAPANRPDYLILTIHRGIRTTELEWAEAAKVPVFIINAGLLKDDQLRVGGPRHQFKYWIGQMVPNEEQAGFDLATHLLSAGRTRFPGAPLSLVALGGRDTDLPSVDRDKGLRRAVAAHSGATLLQEETANYERAQAQAKVSLLFQRNPKANLLWAANDPMALGAMAGFNALGRTAGQDILVGGMDWDPQALTAIQKGDMVASMGGHFFEGAWALILLYDYHHGVDFAQERVSWQSRMYALSRSNVATFTRIFGDRNWSKIRFKAFSKVFHPEIRRYAFGIEALLYQQPAPPKR